MRKGMTVRTCLAYGLFFGMLMCSACATAPYDRHLYETACTVPDLQLAESWELLVESRSAPGGCGLNDQGQNVCRALKAEIERIAFVCPNHLPSLMTSAVLAYEGGERVKALQRLNTIFDLVTVHPDAATLRARIALEEGNAPFALMFLKEHLELSLDHAPLREAYAAAMFLSGDLEGAETQLKIAEKLGAPRWRIAYHLGLFEERQGREQNARHLYREASDLRPGWGVPLSRLKGLLAVPASAHTQSDE